MPFVKNLDAERPTFVRLTADKHATNLRKLTAGHPKTGFKNRLFTNNQRLPTEPPKKVSKSGLYMPSYFLGTFTEYPYLDCLIYIKLSC